MTKNQKRRERRKKQLLRYSIKHKVGKYADEKIAERAKQEWGL